MPKEKLSIQLITYLSGFDGFTAYSIILGVLFICGMGVPIPEDITLIAAGILAALGNISFAGALIVGLVGVLVGDSLLFFMGRRYGYRVFKLPLFKKIFTEHRIEMSRQRILTNSSFICFTARFLPGLRAPIYLTAGIMGVNPITFLMLDGLAALISVPVWIYLGFYLGENIDTAVAIAGRAQMFIVATVVIVIVGYILYKKKFSKRTLSVEAKLPNFDESTKPQFKKD